MRWRLPRSGYVLRTVILLAPVTALLAGVPQGYAPPPWLVVVVTAFSLAYAVMPEHYVGSFALAIVVVWWVIGVRDALPFSAVLAAGALVVAQVAGTIAAYGPQRLAPDPGVVAMWLRRGVLAWATSALTWLVVDAEAGRATSASYWVAGLVVGLALVVTVTALYPSAGDEPT